MNRNFDNENEKKEIGFCVKHHMVTTANSLGRFEISENCDSVICKAKIYFVDASFAWYVECEFERKKREQERKRSYTHKHNQLNADPTMIWTFKQASKSESHFILFKWMIVYNIYTKHNMKRNENDQFLTDTTKTSVFFFAGLGCDCCFCCLWCCCFNRDVMIVSHHMLAINFRWSAKTNTKFIIIRRRTHTYTHKQNETNKTNNSDWQDINRKQNRSSSKHYRNENQE